MVKKNESQNSKFDSNNSKRRDHFRKAKMVSCRQPESLDEYLQFLSEVQKVFSSIETDPKKISEI